MKQTNVIEEVTNKVLELLEKVDSGDILHWIPESGLAFNPYSDHTYSNLNQLMLSLVAQEKGYATNRWMTFKQIKKVLGDIKPGEKSSIVTFVDTVYKDKNGHGISKDAALRLLKEKQIVSSNKVRFKDVGITTRRFLKIYRVFNLAQTENIPDDYLGDPFAEISDMEQRGEVDLIVDRLGVHIDFVSGDTACYRPKADKIQMPFPEQFETTEHYYQVLFHEIMHWTGHQSRLNRIFGKDQTDEIYAFEELIAELGSSFICAKLGIQSSIRSSSAYIKSWLEQLRNDHMFIIKACSYAERAMYYILNHQGVSV